MCAFIFFLLSAIIHSSLGGAHQSQYCRDELDHYQNGGPSDSYIRRSYLDGEEIQARLVPAIIPYSSEVNRNRNINVNSNARSQPASLGAYSEWWEVVTERAPHGGKSAYIRVDPSRHTSYDTIKTHIINDHDSGDSLEEAPRHGVIGHSHQFVELPDESHSDYRKHAPTLLGASRRSKVAPAPEKAESDKAAPQKSPKKNQNVLKNRKNPEGSDLQNEQSRKSNENVNTNVNSNARRSSNKNQNINVNDHSSNAIDESLFDTYQKAGKGSMESEPSAGAKSLGQSPQPMGDRSHSNVNHNVNANVNSDSSLPAAIIRPDNLRRNLINKKRYLPHGLHPNDNHNVNININGEEPAEELEEEAPPGGHLAEAEAENPVTKKD